MMALVPVATAPVIWRLARVDFPVPGCPRMNSPGLTTRPARSHASGSRQTTSPNSWCRPTGVPTAGVPEPATYGNSPQTCVGVAWYSGAAVTCTARPAYGTFHPHAGGTEVTARAGCGDVMIPDSCLLVGHPLGQVGGADAAR